MTTHPSSPASCHHPHTTRRRLLQGLGAAAVGFATSQAIAPTAAAAPGTVTLTPGDQTIDVASTSGQVQAVPTVLGGALSVTGGDLDPHQVMRLTWDNRVYLANDAPTLLTGTGTHPCAFTEGPTADGDTTAAALTVTDPLPPGTYTLMLGSTRPLVCPSDVVDQIHPTTFTVDQAPGSQSQQTPADTGTSTDSLWGARLGVAWDTVEWGSGYRLWVPVAVSLASVGPAPVPAGSTVEISLDAAVFTDLKVTSEAGTASTATTSGLLTSSLALSADLPAGQTALMSATLTHIDLTAPLTFYNAPLLEITAVPGAEELQRLTGAESATREDNAYNPRTWELYGEQT